MGNTGPVFTQVQADALYQTKGNYATTTELDTATQEMTSLQTRFNTTNTTVGGLQTLLNTINRTIGSLNTGVTGITGSIGSFNITLAQLNTTAGELQNSVSALQSTAGALWKTLGDLGTTVNTNFTTLNDKYTTLNTSYNALNTSYTTLNTDLTGVRGSIGTLTTAVMTLDDNYNTLSTRTVWCATGDRCQVPDNKRLNIGDYSLFVLNNRLCFGRTTGSTVMCYDGTGMATMGNAADCVMSPWSAWGTCTGTSQTRTRTVVSQPYGGGAACPLNTTDTRSCAVVAAPTAGVGSQTIYTVASISNVIGTPIRILTTDHPNTRRAKVDVAAISNTNSKTQITDAIVNTAFNTTEMYILPDSSAGIEYNINVTVAGRYRIDFQVFAPGNNSDSFFVDLSGPGLSPLVNFDWQGIGNPTPTGLFWADLGTYTMGVGTYRLAIRGRESTGVAGMRLTRTA